MDDVVIEPVEPREIRGRHLRYLLTTLLMEAHRPLTVAELVDLCHDEGVVFTGIRRRVAQLRDYLSLTRTGVAVQFPWPTSLYAPRVVLKPS